MPSDKFAQWWCYGVLYKQTSTICKPKRIRIFALIINCTMITETNSRFPGTYMQQVTEYDLTNISGTQPRKNMITMGKGDTSDLMMIITWAIDVSFQSPRTAMGQLNTYNPIKHTNTALFPSIRAISTMVREIQLTYFHRMSERKLLSVGNIRDCLFERFGHLPWKYRSARKVCILPAKK